MFTAGDTAVRSALVDVCRRLSARGMVAATDGNVSARLSRGTVLATRSGISKGMMTTGDLIEVTDAGKLIGGGGKPSTELGMHLYIYRERPDVGAVVHAHPIYATAFATARIPLDRCTFPEVIVGIGAIPLAEYATPSTREVAASLAPYVKTADAILLANHGAVTYGRDVLDAYFKMEKLEHAAHITFAATLLGGARALSAEEVERLRRISVSSYGKDLAQRIACRPAGPGDPLTEEEVRLLVEDALRRRGIH